MKPLRRLFRARWKGDSGLKSCPAKIILVALSREKVHAVFLIIGRRKIFGVSR